MLSVHAQSNTDMSRFAQRTDKRCQLRFRASAAIFVSYGLEFPTYLRHVFHMAFRDSDLFSVVNRRFRTLLHTVHAFLRNFTLRIIPG